MIPHWLSRTEVLLGKDQICKLQKAHILIVGLGGVGGMAAEMLVRAGIGKLTIVDGDIVDPTNRNRQVPALLSTEGLNKVDVMAQRLLDINPELNLEKHKLFLTPELINRILQPKYDIAIDCFDSILPKIHFIKTCKDKGIKIISSMGAGGTINPMSLKISDISKMYNCKFGKEVKKRLKKIGISKGVRVIFSTELQNPNAMRTVDGMQYKKSYYGTISLIPATFGIYCAYDAIDYLLNRRKFEN